MSSQPTRPVPPPRDPADEPARRAPLEGVCKELDVLIRARYPIIYVVSWEKERVERQLAEIARQRNKKFFTWTLTQGL